MNLFTAIECISVVLIYGSFNIQIVICLMMFVSLFICCDDQVGLRFREIQVVFNSMTFIHSVRDTGYDR